MGDTAGAGRAMREIGLAQIFLGANDEAEASIRSALASSREAGDRRGEAWALQHLAWISFVQGRSAEAESRLGRSADTFAELGDVGGLGWATGLLAYVKFNQGHLDEARLLGEQVLVESRERGDRWGEGMMLMLSAGVALWSGRSNDGVSFAREAHAVFQNIGDRFGSTQSLAAIGRGMVTVGRVEEGLDLLAAAYRDDPADPRDDERITLAAALAGAAVAAGEPDIALEAIDRFNDEALDRTGPGDVERVVAAGLALLQVGRVSEAVADLRPPAEGTPDVPPSAYAQSALAFALAAAGEHDEVLALADEVDRGERSTYLDRMTADIAVGLVLARDGDESAVSVLEAVVEAVDALEDEVAKAVARTAEAAAHELLGLPSAAEATHVADARLAALGITGVGWRTAIRLVLQPEIATV